MIKKKKLQEYRVFLIIGVMLLVGILAFRFVLSGETITQSSFELDEGIGNWQIFDPFRDLGYTGSLYTTDERANTGNYSLKFQTSTSYNHEFDGTIYVSTVCLSLFFASPLEPTAIIYEYEYDGELITRTFPALDPVTKADLTINPIFECYFWGVDTTRIRIDLTAWDLSGNPIGRGTEELVEIDPDEEWVYYKENVVEALNEEVGMNWLAIRSISIRLFDERSIMQPSYSDYPVSVFIDDFQFYIGEPTDYEDNPAPQQYAPFGLEGALLSIPAIIIYKKIRNRKKGEEEEYETIYQSS